MGSYVIHASEYDPVKAREYYLRTRELKGRRRGSSETTTSTSNGRSVTRTLSTAPEPPIESATKDRTAKFKVRLEKLKAVLEQLVKEAKDRSGVDQPAKADDTAKDATEPAQTKAEDKTAAQKRDAAKAAKDYYEENKDAAAIRQDIADVKAKIKDAREKIALAVAKAREEAAAKVAAEVKTTQTTIDPTFKTGGLRN